jgi:D-alanyl-D-alanine carboxypeptidase
MICNFSPKCFVSKQAVRFQVLILVLAVLLLPGALSADTARAAKLQEVIEAFIDGHPKIPAVIVRLDSDKLNLHWSGSAGVSDISTGQTVADDQPVRLASTTKTYVAAAILRLMEMGKLSVDDPINKHLPEDQLSLLADGGYDARQITIRHLLTHTSGLWDYAMSDAFYNAVNADPQHRWTREEQVRFAVENGQPYGNPGDIFHYSDTGYILLGEIVEQKSGLDFATALRKLLRFETIGLNSTWLETLEPTPSATSARAHQYMGDADTHDYDPSFDLYGGGGLVANMPDLAHFFGALFKGRIFEKPSTLAMMKTTIIPSLGGPGRTNSQGESSLYCMGIAAGSYKDLTIWSHSGFWGTQGAYVPALDLAIGLALTQQHSSGRMNRLIGALLEQVLDSYQE